MTTNKKKTMTTKVLVNVQTQMNMNPSNGANPKLNIETMVTKSVKMNIKINVGTKANLKMKMNVKISMNENVNKYEIGTESHAARKKECQDEDECDAANEPGILSICWLHR
jgi:hypothetical protein